MTIFEDYFSSLYQQAMESNNFEKCFELEESKEQLLAAFSAGVEASAKVVEDEFPCHCVGTHWATCEQSTGNALAEKVRGLKEKQS